MNMQFGSVALNQIISSLFVVGLLLIIVGIFYFVFYHDRRVAMAYLVVGVLLAIIGAYSLSQQLHVGKRPDPQQASEPPAAARHPQSEIAEEVPPT
jgi:uncharacterized membrane protein HdeD (DUF308 family)